MNACANKKNEEKEIKAPDKTNEEDLGAMGYSDEDKCISLVSVLPEVDLRGEEIDMNPKGKNHLTIWVAAKPSETKIKYYWVKAGEDNGDNIATRPERRRSFVL